MPNNRAKQCPCLHRGPLLCSYDWKGNSKELKTNWINGGKMTIKRIRPDSKTGKFDLLGTKGNKIDFGESEPLPLGPRRPTF